MTTAFDFSVEMGDHSNLILMYGRETYSLSAHDSVNFEFACREHQGEEITRSISSDNGAVIVRTIPAGEMPGGAVHLTFPNGDKRVFFGAEMASLRETLEHLRASDEVKTGNPYFMGEEE